MNRDINKLELRVNSNLAVTLITLLIAIVIFAFTVKIYNPNEIPKSKVPKFLCHCKSNPIYNSESSIFDGLECLSEDAYNNNNNNKISDECVNQLSNFI